MMPSILIGDHILVDVSYYRSNEPKCGDVIVFKYPKDKKRTFLKRIIDLPDDVIKIKNRSLFINNKSLSEPYAQYSNPSSSNSNFGPVTVSEKSYFMLGDNRDSSMDSRHWGFLHKKYIKGKVTYVYFSWDKKNRRVRFDRIGKKIQ